MQVSSPATLTTPGPDISFNVGSGDDYVLLARLTNGLDMPPMRRTVDKKGQTDGGIVHPGFYDAWPFQLGGVLRNRTGTVAARNTMEENLRLALHAIRNADGTFTWTPAGQSARSLTVQVYRSVEFPPDDEHPFQKRFLFSLIAAIPSWV